MYPHRKHFFKKTTFYFSLKHETRKPTLIKVYFEALYYKLKVSIAGAHCHNLTFQITSLTDLKNSQDLTDQYCKWFGWLHRNSPLLI